MFPKRKPKKALVFDVWGHHSLERKSWTRPGLWDRCEGKQKTAVLRHEIIKVMSFTAASTNCNNNRKASNSSCHSDHGDMIASASAPGKLILFGEHAVVYNQPAVCAALSDLRICVTAKATTDDGYLEVRMPDLNDLFFRAKMTEIYLKPNNNDDHLYQDQIDAILRSYTELDDFSIQALAPVIYLVNKILFPTMSLIESTSSTPGLHIYVQSASLPVGAGLGSSAAFSVATAAALYKLHMLLLKFQTTTKPENLEEEKVYEWIGRPPLNTLQTINHYAYQAERMNHGTPSGLDNTVSCYGGIIYFTKNEKDGSFTKEQILDDTKTAPSLRVLLTNTGVPRSTKKMVQNFKTFKQNFPHVANGILDSCGAISKAFYSMCQQEKLDPTTMSLLIETNQSLLRAMRVSHPSLERVCDITKQQFGLPTKLTGAGGGGCAFTYLGSNSTPNIDTTTHQMINAIEQQRGVKCMESNAGGPGVLWVVPPSIATSENARSTNRYRRNTSWLLMTGISLAGALLILSSRQRKR